MTEPQVLAKYLTLDQLESLLASWRDNAPDATDEINVIMQAMEEL